MSFSSLHDMLKPKKHQHETAFAGVTAIYDGFKKIAQETLPKNLQNLYTIGFIKEETLYLYVEHAAHAHALTIYKHILLRKMAMTQKKIVVSDIRITQKRK